MLFRSLGLSVACVVFTVGTAQGDPVCNEKYHSLSEPNKNKCPCDAEPLTVGDCDDIVRAITNPTGDEKPGSKMTSVFEAWRKVFGLTNEVYGEAVVGTGRAGFERKKDLPRGCIIRGGTAGDPKEYGSITFNSPEDEIKTPHPGKENKDYAVLCGPGKAQAAAVVAVAAVPSPPKPPSPPSSPPPSPFPPGEAPCAFWCSYATCHEYDCSGCHSICHPDELAKLPAGCAFWCNSFTCAAPSVASFDGWFKAQCGSCPACA